MPRAHNGLSARELLHILDTREWTARELAQRTKLPKSVVSAHLAGQRRIRMNHLNAYMQVFNSNERGHFINAWMRDNFDLPLVQEFLAGDAGLSAEITQLALRLDDAQGDMLDWWRREIARDPELAQVFAQLSRRLGYRGKLHGCLAFFLLLFTRKAAIALIVLSSIAGGHAMHGHHVPHEWLERYSLPASTADDDDHDGDGYSDFEEWVAQTDPTDPNSHPFSEYVQ